MKDKSLIWLYISWGVLVIINIIGFIIVGYPAITTSKLTEGNSCDSNSTLEEKVYCLRVEQGQWWKYNASNVRAYMFNKNIDWDVIKEEGGVCRHSVVWYVEQAHNMGLLAREVSFYPSDKIGHVVALIYDENMTGYCILDQQAMPKCSGLDPVGVEEI